MNIPRTANPTSLDANNPFDSFGITVNTSNSEVLSAVNSGVVAKPLIDEIGLKNVLIQREDNLLGGDDNLTVFFEVAEALQTNIAITLDLPVNISFVPLTTSMSCFL
jgi:hypothetical protein